METQEQEIRLVVDADGTESALGLDEVTSVDDRVARAVNAEPRLFPHVVRLVGANIVGIELVEGSHAPREVVTVMKGVRDELNKKRNAVQ